MFVITSKKGCAVSSYVCNKHHVKKSLGDDFYSALVRYVMELAAKFHTSSIIYSVDNKNKIKLGNQISSVDRRLKINRFFPTSDKPNLSDHDFPTPGYYIVPCGYLKMVPASPPCCTKDQIGRDQFV